MARTLSPETSEHIRQLEAMSPFVWLFEMQKGEGDTAERYRVTNFDKRINYGEQSDGTPNLFYPAPVVVDTIEEDADGGLPTIDITIFNSGPLMMSEVDDEDGFVDQPFRIMLVSTLDLESDPAIDERAKVVSAGVGEESVTFTVGAQNLFLARFPPFVYSRTHCRWLFGGSGCLYNLAAPGALFTQCGIQGAVTIATPFSLAACEAVGEEELARGIDGLHPERMGFNPGIPRQARG